MEIVFGLLVAVVFLAFVILSRGNKKPINEPTKSPLSVSAENENQIDELKKLRLSDKAADEISTLVKRVESGEAHPSWVIGECYESGEIYTPKGKEPFPKNKTKALWWKIKSAEDGSNMAQYELGRIYLFDNALVSKNYEEALKWLNRAAENDSFTALAALGDLYFRGEGVSQDYQKSFDWFSRSLEHKTAKECGFYDAALRIGEMYATGNGVGKDYIQAYKWMKIAGCEPEQHHEFSLRGKLSAEEKERAEYLANEWILSQRASLKK